MVKKIKGFFPAVYFLFLVAGLRAADRLEVTAPEKVMVGGGSFSIRVVPSQGGAVDSRPTSIQFLNLPKEVTILPKTPEAGLVLNGVTEFQVYISTGFRTGPLGFVVVETSAPTVMGSAVSLVEGMPARVVVSPLPPVVGQLSPRVQLVVLEARGGVVTSFQEDVLLSVSPGSLEETVVPGNLFQNGMAQVPLVFKGSVPNVPVRVTASLKMTYPGQSARVRGSMTLSLGGKR